MSGPLHKSNLAALPTRFIGREHDFADLHDHLRRARLISLLGPPGAGKTRLATEYALRHGNAFTAEGAGGVWFCDLAEARCLDDLFHAIAEAVDLPLGSEHTEESAQARLTAALAGRGPTLLILDNFEQLIPVAVRPLERLLRHAPELCVLVTSRTKLDIAGEVVHEIDGLELPDPVRGIDSDAVRLFVDRARAARSDFVLVDDERAIVAEVVTLLDGLPLAIELAGARMGVLGPRQLLERLQKSLDFLRGGSGRARTLRAALDWSWDLLSPHEQDTLAQLSAFRGGFSLEAAEAVVDLSSHRQPPDLLDVLESLRKSSLLKSSSVADLPGEVRFGLLDIVRRYAEEQLLSAGKADATLARHARFFVDAATSWASRVERSDGPENLRRLAIALPNLMAVHRRSLADETPSDARLTDALLVTLALEHVFYMRGPTAPCLAMVDRVFEHVLDGVEPRWVALGLKARGRALRDLGQVTESQEALERALQLTIDTRDRSTEARVRGHLAFCHMLSSADERALACFSQALDAARDAGDRRSEGMLQAGIGSLFVRLGRLDEAAHAFDEALVIDGEVGNRYAAAAALAARGELNRARGRAEAARADLEAAIDGYREFGERRHEGMALTELGVLHQEQGRFAEAEACLARAQQQHREMGSRHFHVTAMATLADLERERGQLGNAKRLYGRALRVASELGDRVARARIVVCLAGTEAALGHPDAARELLDDAEAAARELGDASLLRVVELERIQLALVEAAGVTDHERAAELESELRARFRATQLGAPLATRPATERLAQRLLARAFDGGAPPPSRELTPTATQNADELGRYELLTEIASGGMATVLVGRQRGAGGFDRLVAIKRMHRHLTALPELTAAFMDEARIASLVRHPNVVSVHDVYEFRGERLLIMDYVDGASLSEVMLAASKAKQPISPGVGMYVVAQALRGLHAAHSQRDVDGAPLGIVHRDATPHNILLGADGSVRLTDFGIAQVRKKGGGPEPGGAKGKLRYMAPEQARGEVADRRVDVFALGVVAWELLTGRRLFDGDSDITVVAQIGHGHYPAPAAVEASVHAELSSIIERALSYEPEQRFPDALVFAEALEAWAERAGERAREPEVAALVEVSCGRSLAQRRRTVSDALTGARSDRRSVPPTSNSPASLAPRMGVISIGEGGRWFEIPGAERVSLQRRRALRLILEALVRQRIDSPAVALAQNQLLEAGWPGEKVRHEAGSLRVYNALSTLRKLGLRSVIVSRDDGYLLDPRAEFVVDRAT